ncbi:MAG: AI-2E family transporter [Pseudomonadota bacterium]
MVAATLRTMDKDSTDKGQRIARTLLVAGLLLLGLFVAGRFLPALLWAVIIAVAVDPLHLKLRARLDSTHRIVLPLAITAAAALVVLAPLALGVAQAAREAHDIGLWIATAQATGLPVPDWVARLPVGSDAVRGWWQANLATPEGAAALLHGLRGGAWIAESRAIGVNLLHRAVIFGFTLLALFFVLRDRDSLIAQARRGADKWLGATGERVGEQALRSVRGTIDGLVLVGLGVGAVMAAAYFALGVPHPLMLGALTAIAAMIPFGAPLVFVLAALLLVVAGAPGAAIAVLVIGTVVMFVADHFIRPALIGGATRLPFIWVLIGILGGVETMGLLGLFIGPAAMAVLVMLWREFLAGGGEAPSL